MNDCLRLLTENAPLILDPTDGGEMLGQATDAFRYIDHKFHRWSCNVVGPPARETAVWVYEMVRDSSLRGLFGGFGVALDSLVFSARILLAMGSDALVGFFPTLRTVTAGFGVV